MSRTQRKKDNQSRKAVTSRDPDLTGRLSLRMINIT